MHEKIIIYLMFLAVAELSVFPKDRLLMSLIKRNVSEFAGRRFSSLIQKHLQAFYGCQETAACI